MITWTEIVLRLSLASFFGAIIGIERERKQETAGLRTHMMVSLGSCLIIIVSAYGFSDVLGKNIVLDPSRIAAQVVSGIGFIGAGTILFLKQGITKGLTTATGLWTVAAIGLATGAGLFFAASIATFIALVILWVLQPLERRFLDKFRQRSIKVITDGKAQPLDVLNKIFQDNTLDILSCILDKSTEETIISFSFNHIDKPRLTKIISEIQAESGVKEVIWNG
jgi:putative Mg2+ transporter-C (MgtC) family protein